MSLDTGQILTVFIVASSPNPIFEITADQNVFRFTN